MANDDSLFEQVETFVENQYGAEPEHLWTEFPEYEVFRHKGTATRKGKWFLLMGTATGKQLHYREGKSDEHYPFAVLKADPNLIDQLVQRPGYLRGYHMNKRLWLTVVLDGTVPYSAIQPLVVNSYRLTAK